MPVIKISLTEEELRELQALADKEKMSIQDLFRYKLLAKKSSPMFTPEEAAKRAREKFTEDDPSFTLPDIYGNDWFNLDPRMTGVFGKRFFKYVEELDFIRFDGMTSGNRRATYKIVKP